MVARKIRLIPVLLVLNVVFFISVELKFEQCQYPTPEFNPELEVTRYGHPTPFVFTKSTGVNAYSLVDPYRQSALFHEYLLIGPGIANHSKGLAESDNTIPDHLKEGEEVIQLVLYDESSIHSWENDINLVEQNLGKEYLWALINATGMLPSMTLVNTTFEKSFRFRTYEKDTIAYHLSYPNLFRSRETLPPMDVIIEFPAKTRMFQSLKTMIDYQTFGLLRWRLTPSEIVTWEGKAKLGTEAEPTIRNEQICSVPPDNLSLLKDPVFLSCVYSKRFKILENPCIKDMLIMYWILGTKGVPGDDDSYFRVNKLLITIPMVYDLLSYQGFIDLTEAYCPRPDVHEECGEPLDVVLTNDHLVILSDKGLWVSDSLNRSNTNASYPYSMKPLLKFDPIDPCGYLDYFNCSTVGTPVLPQQAVRRQRLFYTPICHLFQYPIYEDMLMLVIEHVSQAPDLSEERDVVTVLYSAKPYNDWKMLFYAKHEYISKDGPLAISEVAGMFYNHHRRQFDITLRLRDLNKGGAERIIRFVLPIPTDVGPNFRGYEELNGLLGNGFLEFEFPSSFDMIKLAVNPEPLDVIFYGNQIWVAEAGGAFVYQSVPFVSDERNLPSYVTSCSFNHPDRTFVCFEKTHEVLYPGRVGVTYSAMSTLFSEVTELRFTMLNNAWPFAFRQYVAMLGEFVVGYSGKIMLWYVYDPNDLAEAQQALANKITTDPTFTCDESVQPVNCHVCQRLSSRVEKSSCIITTTPPGETKLSFKMLAIDASKLRGRDSTTSGPLVPFLADGDKVVLFEASVPPLPDSMPRVDYLTEVDVGSKIFCDYTPPPHTVTSKPTAAPVASGPKYNITCPSMAEERRKHSCEMYIKHMKSLERNGKEVFLKGFRRVIYATLIQAFPLRPIPTDVVVLILPNSNEAVIQLGIGMFQTGQRKEYTFQYGDIGQTLYIPGHFSVFLRGFPKYECRCPDVATCSLDPILLHDMTRMVGYATRYYRQGIRIQLRPFQAYILEFTTSDYCEWYVGALSFLNTTAVPCVDTPIPNDVISGEYVRRREDLDLRRNEEHERRELLSKTINAYYKSHFYSYAGQLQPPPFPLLATLHPHTYQEIEDQLLVIPEPAVGLLTIPLELNITLNTTDSLNPQIHKGQGRTSCLKRHWYVHDGGCHLKLYLSKNSVLKQSGGRISLDKFDSISFQVKLRPFTPIGKSLIHRPLMVVTNTNPDILVIEQTEAIGRDVQIMNITLSPSGFRTGVSTITIRPLIVSNQCLFAEGSFSLIVQVQRAPGRRLHVNYPVPTCKPVADGGGNERPWKVDLPFCVTRDDLLKKQVIKRPDSEIGQVFYSELPVNYRPPSYRGADIPLSKILYNVDPSKPWYKQRYRISQETGELGKCKTKKNRKECECSTNDELSDDEIFSDCKRMVYTAKRGFRVDINVEYDRIMRDEDQHLNFFSPKRNWSVFLEEINGRKEFTFSSQSSPYIDLINSNSHLHQGRKHYDAKTLGVTCHGTGLFHFKVSLGSFESFGDVSGYFIVFIPDSEFNHVQLIIIMLLTITTCMVLVFCGFLLVRRRLSSQLPFQTQTGEKIKLE